MADTKLKLHLQIITPNDVKLGEDADMVIMRCTTGDMGIMPRHKSISAILDYGALRILNDGSERRMAVFGGIAQVQNDEVIILANDAQWPEDIDRARAEREHEMAENRLRESEGNIDIQSNQVTMRRTLVQMEVSSYPLISGKVSSGVSSGSSSGGDSAGKANAKQ
jgi:F-type H+-transporting ATPase subunit epsilon